ncbi:MAG TPA: UbiA family prenyltransferase [Gammaproteobacteria bacterium]|nr:UbiA family prenyltransferase [Gammaproteobacteria bacterium]
MLKYPGIFLRAIRIHQWTKNLLVFVPLMLGHYWGETANILNSMLGFLSFSLMASGFYLINDVIDIEADRQHPRKRFRPIAAGQLPVRVAYILSLVLVGTAVLFGFFLGNDFLLVLGIYSGMALLYSNYLKKIELVDIAVLAGLYTLRIIAGATAIDVAISFWLAAFSVFIFFSLAMIKRYSELHNLQARQETHSVGRGYRTSDLPALSTMGVASGYIAVLILALYINDPNITQLYSNPAMLWMICPAVLFWITSLWFTAYRGEMDEDPIVFALKHRTSYGIAAISLTGLWLAL